MTLNSYHRNSYHILRLCGNVSPCVDRSSSLCCELDFGLAQKFAGCSASDSRLTAAKNSCLLKRISDEDDSSTFSPGAHVISRSFLEISAIPRYQQQREYPLQTDTHTDTAHQGKRTLLSEKSKRLVQDRTHNKHSPQFSMPEQRELLIGLARSSRSAASLVTVNCATKPYNLSQGGKHLLLRADEAPADCEATDTCDIGRSPGRRIGDEVVAWSTKPRLLTSVLPPTAETAIPSPLGMGLDYLLLSVHRPGGGQMRGLGPFRRRRRRPSLARDGVDDVHAAVLVGEPHGRLPSWTGRVLDRSMGIRRVHVLIEIVGAIVLLHPVGHVGLPVVGHRRWRVAEAEHLVRRRRGVQFALLRDLPLLPHHPLQVLEKVARRSLIGSRQLLGRREPCAVRPTRWRRLALRQSRATGFLLGRQIEGDLLASSGLRLGRRRRLLNGHSTLRLRTGCGFQLG